MKNRISQMISALVVVAALLFGSLTFRPTWLPVGVANAQSTVPATTLPRTITVVGEGKVSISPDIARAQIGVEVMMASVKEASDANKELIDAVLAALMAQGIDEKDIQTSGFSVYAERFGPEGPLPADQTNYRVSNNISVTVRDLATLGDVLDAAIEAGANNIYGVEFSLDDPSSVESEARQRAVADALAKAEELAELTGATIGQVVTVSEVIGNGGGYYSSNFAQASNVMSGGGSTPISPGQLELVMQLQVTYAIGE